jgi:glycosyltransferase involved in cell wall biosynthesis
MDDFPLVERPDRPGLRALALGRTSPAKGYEAMIRAVAQARPDVSLDVYGPSASAEETAHRATLESLVADLGLAERVRIHEAVPRTEVPRLLAEHDCLVNNMRPGATDKVVYEASSSGLPVLASNPAFDDLFAGLDLAFPTDDVDALAARLDRLAALDGAGRAELGRTLRERAVAGHSVDAWARRLLEVVPA